MNVFLGRSEISSSMADGISELRVAIQLNLYWRLQYSAFGEKQSKIANSIHVPCVKEVKLCYKAYIPSNPFCPSASTYGLSFAL